VEVPETFSSAANTPASGSSWLRGLQVRAHTGAIALAPSFSKVAVSVLDVSIRATSCRIDIGGDDLPAVGACRQNLGAAQIQFTTVTCKPSIAPLQRLKSMELAIRSTCRNGWEAGMRQRRRENDVVESHIEGEISRLAIASLLAFATGCAASPGLPRFPYP
jgi:hypothetical protein